MKKSLMSDSERQKLISKSCDVTLKSSMQRNSCLKQGAKKVGFYGLPFGQVVASILYYPKSLLSSPKKSFDEQH